MKEDIDKSSPAQTPTNKCTHLVTMAIAIQPGKLYIDQTRRFPYISNWRDDYFVDFYMFDTNTIIAEPIKNCSHSEITTAYQNGKNSLHEKVSSHDYTSSTMKHLQPLKNSSSANKPQSNTPHLTFTDKMPPNVQSNHVKTISL